MDIIGLGTMAMDAVNQVNQLPEEDGFCIINNTSYLPGGSGTNVIVQLQRLSANCGFIGKISDDKIGKDILTSLQGEGIDTNHLLIQKGGISLHTNIFVDQNGRKFIMLNTGDVFFDLKRNEVSEAYLKMAKIFYTDLLPKETAIYGLKQAKKLGLLTAFNMQIDLGLMNRFGISKQEILESLKYVDVFAPCRQGLFELTGSNDLTQCNDYLRDHFSGILIVTLGEEGVAAFDNDGNFYKESVLRVDTVDTTGAGDSFIGAFLYSYLLRSQPIQHSLRFSTICAAYTCMGLGARSSPTLREVADFSEKMTYDVGGDII